MFTPIGNRLIRSGLVLLALVAMGAFSFAGAQTEDKQAPVDALGAAPGSDKGEDVIVTIQTTMGNMVVKLFPEAAPKAVENFLGLAEKGYYEGVTFHRVIKDFMVQGGDPTGNGYGGKSIWGTPFEDEFSQDVRFDRRGLLAMANAGPKTNGSQFFLTLKATPWLNDRHTIFGEIVEGIEVLDAIGEVETGPGDKPIKEISMTKVVAAPSGD